MTDSKNRELLFQTAFNRRARSFGANQDEWLDFREHRRVMASINHGIRVTRARMEVIIVAKFGAIDGASLYLNGQWWSPVCFISIKPINEVCGQMNFKGSTPCYALSASLKNSISIILTVLFLQLLHSFYYQLKLNADGTFLLQSA